jgi:hypothetical protein
VALLIGVSGAAAAAFRAQDASVDANLIRAMSDLGVVAGAPGAAGFTALFAATAIAGYRHAPFRPWVAGLSALAAITQPLAFGVGVTDHGVFASDGVLGLLVPIVTFVVAMLTLSLALVRNPIPRRPASEPASSTASPGITPTPQ